MGILDFFKNKNKASIQPNQKSNLIDNENEKIDYELLNGGDNSNLSFEEKKAIFLNYFKVASPIKKNNEYPSYFIYSYNIIDPAKFHLEMINEGLFKKANFEEILESYKINELKEIILKYNINSKKNNKKEMCKNIDIQLDNTIKEQIVNKSNSYVLSEIALVYLEKYKDLLILLDNYEWHISYNLYNKYKNNSAQYLKFRDIVWSIFNDRLNLAVVKEDYRIIYNTYKNMANFLKNENKNIDAIKYYLTCLYLELNYYNIQEQIKNYNYIHIDDIGKEYLLRILNNRNLNIISKDLIMQIKELQENYNSNIMEKVYIYCDFLRYHFISNYSFEKFVNELFNSSYIDEDKYIKEIIENASKVINSHQ